MSQKWSASSDLELKFIFDPKLDAELLKNVASEDIIKGMLGIEYFWELDDVVVNDLLKRVAPVLEKHTDEINDNTVTHIMNLYKDKSLKIYEISNNLSVNNHEELIILKHYIHAEDDIIKSILSDIKDYNNDLMESSSFKSFVLSLEKFLLQYGLVLEECKIKYDYTSKKMH